MKSHIHFGVLSSSGQVDQLRQTTNSAGLHKLSAVKLSLSDYLALPDVTLNSLQHPYWKLQPWHMTMCANGPQIDF